MVSVATTWLFYYDTKAATDYLWINVWLCSDKTLLVNTGSGVEWIWPVCCLVSSLLPMGIYIWLLRAGHGSGQGSHSPYATHSVILLLSACPLWCDVSEFWANGTQFLQRIKCLPPVLLLVGTEDLFVGLESRIQKLRRLTTYSSRVTPMPPCLPVLGAFKNQSQILLGKLVLL